LFLPLRRLLDKQNRSQCFKMLTSKTFCLNHKLRPFNDVKFTEKLMLIIHQKHASLFFSYYIGVPSKHHMKTDISHRHIDICHETFHRNNHQVFYHTDGDIAQQSILCQLPVPWCRLIYCAFSTKN